MAARFDDVIDGRARPRHHDGTPYTADKRRDTVRRYGEHEHPALCEHPVEARVTAYGWTGYVARCNNCGLHLLRNGLWVYA